MTNTVAEFWDAELDGAWYSLHSYAYQVTSIGGSRTGVPSLRGENSEVSGLAGRMHRAKSPEQRVITLAGWLSERDADNVVHPSGDLAGFNSNWRTLRRLLWRENGEQFRLRRRWYDESGVLLTGIALAEFGDGLEPPNDKAMSPWSCDLVLADPYFYGDDVIVPLALDTPAVASNDGDATVYAEITFTGEIDSPQITNASTSPETWVKVGSSIAAADSVVLDSDPLVMTATRTSDEANLIGSVTRSGSRHWLPLPAGDSTLTLTASGGTGSASLTYAPAYL